MKLLSSESITYGHPDRMCDTIGNVLLHEYLKQDPKSHVGLEALATENLLVLSGEVKTTASVDVEAVARQVIASIGYGKDSGFDPNTIQIQNRIASQSPDIDQGVSLGSDKVGAGDQGIITGYASRSTPLGLDIPTMAANLLTFAYQEFQKHHSTIYYPDAKSQVTIDPESRVITNVIMAVSHSADIDLEDLRQDITDQVIKPVLHLVQASCIGVDASNPQIIINGTGKFTIYGPKSDCGVIGRKLAVDSYGGYAPLGGGNTNAKDPSKVDASAARAARHLALNLVFAGVCDRCLVKLSYCIGIPEPISVAIDMWDGMGVPVSASKERRVQAWVEENYSFAVQEIIKRLDLTNQPYDKLTATGQFGLVGKALFEVFSDTKLVVPSWEKLDLVPYLTSI